MKLISDVSLLEIKLNSQKIEIFEEMFIVNGCDAYYCYLYSFIVDFHPLKAEMTKERMHPCNLGIISNVSLLIIKLIRQKIEIFEEKLIVNGCDASYCCWYRFIVDFHPLKVELTKERMHAIQCEAFKSCFFVKVKLIGQKIEIFEEMLIVNECYAYYCCLYSFIVDFPPLKVKLTKERMHPYNVWIISNVLCSRSN